MDCDDENVEEHDKYSFFLGTALRNEDPEQFIIVYDSIIPKGLSETVVEGIKDQARVIADLPEADFNELVLKARQFSLAETGHRPQKMSSPGPSKEAGFYGDDADDLPYIDEEENSAESSDDESVSSLPNRHGRHIPPFMGLLRPPSIEDDEPETIQGNDSGVGTAGKHSTSLGSGSDKHDDSDSEGRCFDYFPKHSSKPSKPVASVNNQPYDEIHSAADSDSGSQLESPRSDTSPTNCMDSRLYTSNVEMKTFRSNCEQKCSYDSSDREPIHKHLYGAQLCSANYTSMNRESAEDYEEFDTSGLRDRPKDNVKPKTETRRDVNVQKITFPSLNKTSTSVDDKVIFPVLMGRQKAEFTTVSKAEKGSSTSRDWATDRGNEFQLESSTVRPLSSRFSSMVSSGSFDSNFSSLDGLEMDDSKKKKKKKKGSKDDNDIPGRKERSQIDVNGNPIEPFPSLRNYHQMRELHQPGNGPGKQSRPLLSGSSRSEYGTYSTLGGHHSDLQSRFPSIDTCSYSLQKDAIAELEGNHFTSETDKRKARQKKKRDKIAVEVHPENEEGYIGDKDIDFILHALESGKPGKPKKLSGQKDMTVQGASKLDKSETKNAKNVKSERKQKQTVLLVSGGQQVDSVENISSVAEPSESQNNEISVECGEVYANMGSDQSKLQAEEDELLQVVVEKVAEPPAENTCSEPANLEQANSDMNSVITEQHALSNEITVERQSEAVDGSQEDNFAVNGPVDSSDVNCSNLNVFENVEIDGNNASENGHFKQKLLPEVTPPKVVAPVSDISTSDITSTPITRDLENINCDKIPVDVAGHSNDLSNIKNVVARDFYIFTDVEIPPVDLEPEFCPVVHKKKKRTSAKDSCVHMNVPVSRTNHFHDPFGYRHEFTRHEFPKNDNRKFTRSVTPPPLNQSVEKQRMRDLSPSAFPALGGNASAGKGRSSVMDGRRNSTGDVTIETAMTRIQDDSDIESVKSLPVASQSNDSMSSSPGLNKPVISYAKVAASPKPHSNNLPLSPPPMGSPQDDCSNDDQSRQLTVWKGNVRERRHSLGSSPDGPNPKEAGKVAGSLKQKSGSQEFLAVDIECASKNIAVVDSGKCEKQSDESQYHSQKTVEKNVCSCPNNMGKVSPASAGTSPSTCIVSTGSQSILKSHKASPNAASFVPVPMVHVERTAHVRDGYKLQPDASNKLTKNIEKTNCPNVPLSYSCSETSPASVYVHVNSETASLRTISQSAQGNKSSRGGRTLGPIVKLPSNNGKKFKQSVIFLDRRLSEPPQDLGITFGFEPDLEGDKANIYNSGSTSPSSNSRGGTVSNSCSVSFLGCTADSLKGEPSVVGQKASGSPGDGPHNRAPSAARQSGSGDSTTKGSDPVKYSFIVSANNNTKAVQTQAAQQTLPLSAGPSSASTSIQTSNKAVCALSTLNGLVMPLVQGDKSSLSHVQDGLILPPTPCPPASSVDQHYQPPQDPSIISLCPSPPIIPGYSENFVTVLYGASLTSLTASPSLHKLSGTSNPTEMTSGVSAERNGPQTKLIRYQPEESVRGKFNWEEAAMFLKRGWDKVLSQKEKNTDSVMVYTYASN